MWSSYTQHTYLSIQWQLLAGTAHSTTCTGVLAHWPRPPHCSTAAGVSLYQQGTAGNGWCPLQVVSPWVHVREKGVSLHVTEGVYAWRQEVTACYYTFPGNNLIEYLLWSHQLVQWSRLSPCIGVQWIENGRGEYSCEIKLIINQPRPGLVRVIQNRWG